MTDVALRDCGQWLSGGTPDTENPGYWGGDIPWITSSSLKGRYLDRSQRQLTEDGVVAGSRLVKPGTLVFVVRGMSLKREFRVGISTRPLAFGQDCKALVPAKGIDPKYLLCALEAAEDRVLRMVDEASHGTGRLQTSLLGALRLRMPPLEEQRRIAEVLDSIDETIQATERVIAKLRSGLVGALSDLLEAASSTPAVVPLSVLVRRSELGTTLRGRNGTERVRLIKMGSVDWGVLTLRQVEDLWVQDVKALGAPLEDGEILFNTRNTPDLVGKVAVWRSEDGTLSFPDNNLLRLQLVQPDLADLLVFYLARGSGRSLLRGLATGTTSVAAIYWRDLSTVPCPDFHLDDARSFTELASSGADRLASEHRSLLKLRETRAGLAADLLSGLVRTAAT